MASGRDLQKVGGTAAWNAGASSIATLVTDGYVEFTTLETTSDKMAGLSNGDDGAGYADIDFAVSLLADGHFAVREGGLHRGRFGTYEPGDLFRVEVAGGVVRYKHEGAVFYTSAIAPTFPLVVDTSLRTPGATITDATLSPTVTVFDNADGAFVWVRTCDCSPPVTGNYLDIRLPAEEQTGVGTVITLESFAMSPTVGDPGGFWLKSWRDPDEFPFDGAHFAAAPGFYLPGSDPYEGYDDVFILPALVKEVGDTIGPADHWVSGGYDYGDPAGVQTAHFQDSAGETATDQVFFKSGIIGIRFGSNSSRHYGFVELAWRPPDGDPDGLWGEYVPVRWGYHTLTNTALVVPP